MKKTLLISSLFFVASCVQAQALNTDACLQGNGEACYLLAIEQHKAKKFDEAEKYALRACELNNAMGCFYVGFKNQNAGKSEECNAYFKKACDLNLGVGCLAVANNVRLGIGIPPSLTQAMPFYKKACELGEELGCSHVKNPGFEGHHGSTGSSEKK